MYTGVVVKASAVVESETEVKASVLDFFLVALAKVMEAARIGGDSFW